MSIEQGQGLTRRHLLRSASLAVVLAAAGRPCLAQAATDGGDRLAAAVLNALSRAELNQLPARDWKQVVASPEARERIRRTAGFASTFEEADGKRPDIKSLTPDRIERALAQAIAPRYTGPRTKSFVEIEAETAAGLASASAMPRPSPSGETLATGDLEASDEERARLRERTVASPAELALSALVVELLEAAGVAAGVFQGDRRFGLSPRF